MTASKHASIDVVIIGRNEGERLREALASVQNAVRQIVYVDSGSRDDSVEVAKAAGATVVELDLQTPFTAARARNAGFHALASPEIVQFFDGDCSLVEGYLEKAKDFLLGHDDVAVVTGWRSERFPERSAYNLLCEWEWRRPPGEIEACGGDMMVRASAFQEVQGFNPTVIAAEDDEFCVRLGKAGWRLWRIPEEMTKHDANMTTFSQWWKRAERTGHGFAQLGRLHKGYFGRARRRVWIFAVLLPIVALVWLPWSLFFTFLGYGYSYWHSLQALRNDGIPGERSWYLAWLLTVSKFPNLIGMARYYVRRLLQNPMKIIEYK